MNFPMRLSPSLIPPAPRETHAVTLSDGATTILRRHGNPDGPRVALSHGNGMAIEAYFPFWRLMLAAYDVVLFDTRQPWPESARRCGQPQLGPVPGRFRNRPPATSTPCSAPGRFAAIFHSMSGISALLQTRAFGVRWSPLILIDPPIFPPPGHALEERQGFHMEDMEAIALHRPGRFDDPEDLAAVLRSRRAFRRWQPGAHELFALATTRRTADGWVLACPKRLEAQIFAANIDPTIWPEVGAMPGDIAVIGADASLPEVQPPALLGRALAGGTRPALHHDRRLHAFPADRTARGRLGSCRSLSSPLRPRRLTPPGTCGCGIGASCRRIARRLI